MFILSMILLYFFIGAACAGVTYGFHDKEMDGDTAQVLVYMVIAWPFMLLLIGLIFFAFGIGDLVKTLRGKKKKNV